ncbi:MAG TPA: VOC family protein [Trueperaceae bacterium]
MKTVNPYLNFRRETAEAFRFYGEVFGAEPQVITFGQFGDGGAGLPEDERDLVAHAYLPLGNGHAIMASDAPPSLGLPFVEGNNVHIMIDTDDGAEARRLYERLSQGGQVHMELAETGWAELYANLVDRFGIRWMINYAGNKGGSA